MFTIRRLGSPGRAALRAALPLAFLAAGLWAARPTAGQTRSTREYEVKAAVLFNVMRFVEWPTDKDAVRRLCIVGPDPFGDAFVPFLGRQIGDRRFEVRHIADDVPAAGCHALFVAGGRADRTASLVPPLAGPAVLTVGEVREFSDRGGMMTMEPWRNRLRLLVNLNALESAGLRASSQLLSLSSVIVTNRRDS